MPGITEREQFVLTHVERWGSDGYAAFVQKLGRFWAVEPFPVLFDTKREATEQFERYLQVLRDRKAGRL